MRRVAGWRRVFGWAALLGLGVGLGAEGATIHLSPTGLDGNDGSSWASAKKTLAGALAAAGSGDVILATNGTYVSTHFAIDWVKSGETLRSVNGPSATFITRYDSSMPCIRVEGTIDGFTVKDGTTSSAYKGGGIMLIGGAALNCVVTNCTAGGDAGGIYVDSGGVVSNCTVAGNSATANGGGVYVRNGTLTHSTVRGNVAGGNGGGVWINSGQTVENNVVRGNAAGGGGGGGHRAGSAVLRGCVVAGNQSTGNGGGVYGDGCTTESSTIVGNTTGGGGGGMYATMGGSVIRNNVLYYNGVSDAHLSASVTLANSCFGVGVNNPPPGATGSTTNAPQFAQAGSGTGTNHVYGNYLLRPTSPCIDTGVNQGWMSGAQDLAGTNRIINGTVNMGAQEGIGTGKESQTITFGEIADQKATNVLTLAATASSGLTVTFSVASGPAKITGPRTLSFTGTGLATVRASQAGNATYDPAPSVDRSFRVLGTTPFKLTAVALTNSVVLRWPDPKDYGYATSLVHLRRSTEGYAAYNGIVQYFTVYAGTNQMFHDTGLTPGTNYYYSIFTTDDGETFYEPE